MIPAAEAGGPWEDEALTDNLLRILLVIENAGAGSGRHVIDLARGLVKLGHDVVLLYGDERLEPWFSEELGTIPELTAEMFPMRPGLGPRDFGAALRLRRRLRALGRFDILHGHSSKAGALLRLAALGLGTTRVYTPHALYTMGAEPGSVRRLLFGGLERVLARLGEAIVCVSQAEHRHAIELGLPRDKLFVVPNGLAAMPAVDGRSVRAELGLADSDVAIGCVGRLAPQKAIHRLVDAFADLVPERPDARLVIVGSGPDEAALRARAAERGVGDRVIWTGVADGATMMAAFDIFALPSRYEAFPYVLLEALARGLPIVATRVGGAEDVIVEGSNGFITEQDDEPAFVRRLSELVGDPLARQAMSEAAHRRAVLFDVDAMVTATLDVYRTLLARR